MSTQHEKTRGYTIIEKSRKILLIVSVIGMVGIPIIFVATQYFGIDLQHPELLGATMGAAIMTFLINRSKEN